MPDNSATSDVVILDWALVVATLLALLHVAAPRFRGVLSRHTAAVGSLGGGMAVTYVFLNLFPELEVGASIFGKRIHVLVLLGFLVYYGAEHSLGLRESQRGAEVSKRSRFALDLILRWVYSWLLLYSLPDSMKAKGFVIVPLLLAVSLHQAYGDFEMSESYQADFNAWGRYVLSTGPLAGWVTDLYFFRDDLMVSSVCTAVLAGSCLYKAFKRELPESGNSRFRWFLAGVILFVTLHFLANEDSYSARIL